MDILLLLGVLVEMRGICWATVVAAGTGAKGFSTREVGVGARVSSDDRRFG